MLKDEENLKKSIDLKTQQLFQKKLGEHLTQLRKSSGYSNAYDFAVAINITESQYGAYERGEIDIRLSTLRRIFLGNNINIEDLLLTSTTPKNGVIDLNKTIEDKQIEQVREQVKLVNGFDESSKLTDSDLNRIFKILLYCLRPHSKREILDKLRLTNTINNFDRVAGIAEKNQWIMKTNPQKPSSPKQRYYTTELGKQVLNLSNEGVRH